MLPAAQRLTRADEFRNVAREGRRASARTLVVTLRAHEAAALGGSPSRAGFVVSKAVGNAVVRNRVKRRLRHLVRPYLEELGDGSWVVVRALPQAASAPGRLLATDLDRCMRRLLPGTVPGTGS